MQQAISQFSTQFKGGVRANLFDVSIACAGAGFVTDKLQFHCKGASIPAQTIGNIPVPYQGRQLMVPGDRTYADWTATIFSDEGWVIRSQFESWMQQIQDLVVNFQGIGATELYGTAIVSQYRRDGGVEASYSMNCYPTEVAAIDLAWDSNDAVEEYAVTFAVNYMGAPDPGGKSAPTSGNPASWKIGGSVDSKGNRQVNAAVRKAWK